jgi:hypothetical protein
MRILKKDLAFITLMQSSRFTVCRCELDCKQLLLEELSAMVGDKISKQTLEEKIDQFAKYGSLFLFAELIGLRRELEKLREEFSSLKNEELIYLKR